MKKLAAERQASLLAQMRLQQAAAAHMMFDDDEDADEEDGHMRKDQEETLADPLARLQGAQCALCQESMSANGVAWSRFEPSTEEWLDYDDDTCRELEEAYGHFESSQRGEDARNRRTAEILLHGSSYRVDFKVMRQTGPLDDGGTRPGRQMTVKVRRTVNEISMLGFSHSCCIPSPANSPRQADKMGGGKRHALSVSLCGHAMHKSCLHRYIESLMSRRHHIIHGSTFEQAHSIDLNEGEIVCAICRRIANTALPVAFLPSVRPPGTNSESHIWREITQ
jgi:hypothetical protein